jgi:hypothetical protein
MMDLVRDADMQFLKETRKPVVFIVEHCDAQMNEEKDRFQPELESILHGLFKSSLAVIYTSCDFRAVTAMQKCKNFKAINEKEENGGEREREREERREKRER